MKVTFIHHSSFCIELQDRILIFDYFRGGNVPEYPFSGKLPSIDREKKMFVFASHKHRDHFDTEIFQWEKEYPKISYIFSKDMKFSENYLKKHTGSTNIKEKIHYMAPNTLLQLEDMEIETLLSTDAGVAYLITYQGKTIYHAGDLNWWHWEGESDLFLIYQERTYKAQINRLRNRKIYLAMVVMDPRLEEHAFLGMDYLLEQAEVENVIPMHLWQDYRILETYKNRESSTKNQTKVFEVWKENQEFHFP